MPAASERLDLDGAVAWVTGAGRGIGLAIAREVADCGGRVVALDLELTDAIRDVADACETVDIRSFDAVESLASDLDARGLAPRILVNNAGITRDGVLWKMSERDWDDVIAVNLKGAFAMIRHAAPLMRRDGGGSIVNITSINGLRGKFGQANYAASKAGLVGLTKTAARELGRFGVRVNAVAPGMVETEMAADIPEEFRTRAIEESLLGRIARPEDVSAAVLFLASDLAAHVTGQILRVDGGQYI